MADKQHVASDPDHAAAGAWLDANTHALVTTDYVIDELLTRNLRRGACHLWMASQRAEYERAR